MNQTNVSGNRISGILQVIDEIAFNSSILALNAAVAAASESSVCPPWNRQAANDALSLVENSIEGSLNGESAEEARAAIRRTAERTGVETGAEVFQRLNARLERVQCHHRAATPPRRPAR